jgi:class 3 adenylate cyclase
VTQVSPVDYAESSGGFVAYRAVGDAPPDLVLVSDWFSHVGALWDVGSPFRPVLDRLSSFGRLITFDKRGVGLSDPVPLQTLPTLEDWVDDVRTVLDDLGVERATIIGKGSGGPMAALFAATHPDRVSGVVLINAWARLGEDDDFPLGVPEHLQEMMLESAYMPSASVRMLAGEPISPHVEAWWQAYVRNAASPSTSLTMRRWLFSVDVRGALPAVQCPTLVMGRRDAWIGAEHGRYLAARIPRARFVELPGAADFLFTGDTESLLAEIEQFVTGRVAEPVATRVLATVLYTDLVDSTGHATRLGDRRWRQLLDRHDEVVRHALAVGSGREIKATGDGFVATFDGPARAIRCAAAVRSQLGALGLEMRAGLHAGEMELRGDDIGGIAMHIGARIESLAEPGEILVSRTVRDLVAGSGLQFVSRGEHQLKGIPDTWEIYALDE